MKKTRRAIPPLRLGRRLRAVNTCTRYSRECLEESPNGVCIRFKQPPECVQWEMQQRCVEWGPCPPGQKGH